MEPTYLRSSGKEETCRNPDSTEKTLSILIAKIQEISGIELLKRMGKQILDIIH